MAYTKSSSPARTPGITAEQRRLDEQHIERFLGLLSMHDVRNVVQQSLCKLWADDVDAAFGSPAVLLRELAGDVDLSEAERNQFLAAAEQAERAPHQPFARTSQFVEEEVSTVHSEVMRGLLDGLLLAWSLADPAPEGTAGVVYVGAFDLVPRRDMPWRNQWDEAMAELQDQLLSALPLSKESLEDLQKTGAAKVANQAREHRMELPGGLRLTADGDWLVLGV